MRRPSVNRAAINHTLATDLYETTIAATGAAPSLDSGAFLKAGRAIGPGINRAGIGYREVVAANLDQAAAGDHGIAAAAGNHADMAAVGARLGAGVECAGDADAAALGGEIDFAVAFDGALRLH